MSIDLRIEQRGAIDLRMGRWEDVLADIECDSLIVDAPYSEKTHKGHNAGVSSVDHMRNFATLTGGQEKDRRYALRKSARGESHRRSISYRPFTAADVDAFVASWAPRTRGWFVSITDDILAPVWRAALETAGRYSFAPFPFVAPGSRVRMTGDGPTNWAVWIVVARPKTQPYSKWGALPGAYVLPSGHSEDLAVVGGKPLWLCRALVRDYTKPGDLIADPCCGAATTLLAAAMENRRAIGAECDPATYEIARKRIAKGYTPSLDFGVGQ